MGAVGFAIQTCGKTATPSQKLVDGWLQDLESDAPVPRLPPPHQLAIASALLDSHGEKIKPLALLRAAVRRQPNDYWMNWEMASASYRNGKYKESASFYRAVAALRPHQPWTLNRLGTTLFHAGDVEEGIKFFRQSIRLEQGREDRSIMRRNLVTALLGSGRTDDALAEAQRFVADEPADVEAAILLGRALMTLKRSADSIAIFRKAVALDPKNVERLYLLGASLRIVGRQDEAVVEFRKALVLDAKFFDGHFGLGVALCELGRHEEAIAEFTWVFREFELKRKRVTEEFDGDLLRKYTQTRFCHAESLVSLGRFAEADAALQTALALPTRIPDDLGRRRHQQELCRALIPLESRVPALLAGTELPDPDARMLGLAEWCCKYRCQSVTSVRLYEAVFKTQPSLEADLNAGHRFHAACAAATAASGSDSEGAKLDDQAKAGLRMKALHWLSADRDAWIRRRKDAKPGELPAETVTPWLARKELASVRDQAALAQLPEAERENWRKLWADVKVLALQDTGTLLNQARSCVDRRQWAKAAECYAQFKSFTLPNSEPWFEMANAQLLAEDHDSYGQTCQHMLASKGMRAFLVARVCTLAPISAPDLVRAAEISNGELMRSETAFWSLTEQGALSLRSGRAKESVALFEKSLKAETKPGAAVLNWLWLALAHHKLGNTDEAKSWLTKASEWLDNVGPELPANAEASLSLHRHNWLEAHVLRREAEALLSSTSAK